ncbi:GNAT family N-acetyltransferase [Salinispora tropica]|uniref:GNAT family N-acetyltransferase n=1 Tax=Salinispora tropica TaxID=168695 RepID=UPI0003678683|nr:GNAT family N-acetyltransferase [Salinispora tropica]
MDDLSIRDRVPADLKRCISVLADVHRLDRYPLNWPADPYQWLSPDNTRHAWIAERGAAVVGHVVVHHHAAFATDPASPTVAEVGRLFVAPAARRHNTATQLLHHARQWAAEHQLDLTLEIVDDTRSAAAIALYERTGWRHTHTTTAAWTSPEGRPVRLRRYTLRETVPASGPSGDPVLNENVVQPIGSPTGR